MKQMIKNFLDGDIRSLESDLESHKALQVSNNRRLSELEREYATLKSREKKTQEEISQVEKQIQIYIVEIGKEQELISSRSTKLKKMCQDLHVDYDEDSGSFDRAFGQVKENIEQQEKKLRDLIKESEEKDKELQKNIDVLREKKASVQSMIGNNQKTLRNLDSESQALQREIGELIMFFSTFHLILIPTIFSILGNNAKYNELLPTIIKNIEETEKEQKKLEDRSNIEFHKTEMMACRAKRTELRQKWSEIEAEYETLNSFSRINNDIESKQKDKSKKETEMQKIKNKHSENFRTLFPGRTIDRNFKNSVQSLYEKFDSEIKSKTKSLNDSRMQSNNLLTIRNTLKQKSKTDKEELDAIKEKIDEQCDGSDFMSTLNKLKEKIEKQQKELGFKKHSEAFYKKYIGTLGGESCCMLCHRNLDTPDVDDLKTEYDEKIKMLPREIMQAEKELKTDQRKFEILMSLKSDYERIESIERKIEKSKTDIQKNIEEYNKLQQDIEDIEMALVEPNQHFNIVNSIIGDMSLLDECYKDIQNKINEIEILRCQLPEDSPNKTMEEVQTERKRLSEEIEKEEKKITKLDEDISKSQDELNRMRQNLDKMRNGKLELMEKIAKVTKAVERKDAIGVEKAKLETEMREHKESLASNETLFRDALGKKEKVNAEFKKNIEGLRKTVEDINGNRREIER